MGRIRLAHRPSMTVAELLVPFLKLSNNLHAEALTKAMGTGQGRPGNWNDGIAVTPRATCATRGADGRGHPHRRLRGCRAATDSPRGAGDDVAKVRKEERLVAGR